MFVASCHSEIIGQVFLQAGASHVLCVMKDEQISEEISNEFTDIFYRCFFCQNLTFCEAYEIAKERIAAGKFFNGEEKKFIMLKRDRNLIHKCSRFVLKPCENAKLVDFTPVPHFHLSNFSNDCFIGRNQEIYEVIDHLFNSRLLTIKVHRSKERA